MLVEYTNENETEIH